MTDDKIPTDTEISESVTPPENEHEFLIPGPTPTSNEGCFTWGASWVVLSLVLLVIVAIMTVACYFIALLVGAL